MGALETEPLQAQTATDSGKGLAKTLGLWNGISVIVGCIIGSGIFVSPTGVQLHAGSVGVSLLVWFSMGIFAMIGAYCYAELGTMIRKSGGDYAYFMDAYGPFMAFVRLWIEAIVVRPCTAAVVAITFAIYMLRPFFPDCDPPGGTVELLAASLLIILTAVNAMSIRLATFITDFFTLAKIFALCCIIGSAAWLMFIVGQPKYFDSFENIFENTSPNLMSISLACYSGLFAYQGWNYLNFIVEELKDAEKNLPYAIVISCSLCTIIYTLTNIALYTVVSPDEMLASPAVAILFAHKVFGTFAFVMPIFVAFSTIGSANGVIFTSSRLFFVGAREGQFPRLLTMINKSSRTPVPAVIFTGFLSLCYLLLSGNVFTLINYMQIVYWVAIGGAMVALLIFRKTMPNARRPIKVPIILPILFLLGCCALVILPIISNFQESMIGIALLLSGVPVYGIFIAWKGKPKFINAAMESFTVFCQKLFLVVDDGNEDKDA